jgi:hypothetical protein
MPTRSRSDGPLGSLEHRERLRVRFHEVDALDVVRHGHDAACCEQGREARLLAEGSTLQVLADCSGRLLPTWPEFLLVFWKCHAAQLIRSDAPEVSHPVG